MNKHRSDSKDKKKDGQLVIRVDKAERDAFVTLCDRLDTSAAREIRRFMRERVAAHPDENLGAGGESKIAVITDSTNDEPTSVAVTSPKADVEIEALVDVAEKPKKKRKPVVQKPV